jgi:hypothetical protein
MPRSFRDPALIVLLVSVATLPLLCRPALHHWDEFAYLYAAQHQTLAQLASGAFEPSNVAGFFNAKIGYVLLLKLVVAPFGDGAVNIAALQVFVAALLLATALLLYAFLRAVYALTRTTAGIAAALFILSPLSVYLATKLLAEVPAQFAGMLSVLCLGCALRSSSRGRQAVLIVLGAVAVVACVYTRLNSVLMPLAAWAALLFAPPATIPRQRVVVLAAMTGVLALLVSVAIDAHWNLQLLRGALIANVVAGHGMSLSHKMYIVLYGVAPLVFAVPLAALCWKDRAVAFCASWFVFASVPMLLLFRYFEVRWMTPSVPALAGLAALVLVRLWSLALLRHDVLLKAWRVGLVAGTYAAMILANMYIQSRAECGLDAQAIGSARAWIDRNYPGASLLIPWLWTDFHYLRMAAPQAPVYSINTRLDFEPVMVLTSQAAWQQALQRWYDGRQISDLHSLRGGPREPWIVLAANRDAASFNGLNYSWIKDSPDLKKTLVQRVGIYNVFLVERSVAADRPAPHDR